MQIVLILRYYESKNVNYTRSDDFPDDMFGKIPFSIFQEMFRKSSHAAKKNPVFYFPGKSIFGMPPSIPNYRKNLGSKKHPYK